MVLEKIFIVVDAITKPAEKALSRLTDITFNFNKALDRLNKVSMKTRMNFLGVMFAGMALQRAMMNLLSPSLEAVGVFNVFNELLTLMFLPAALLLLDVVMWLFDVFSSLPQPVQDLISGLVLLGWVIGGVLAFIGQLGVGLTSIASSIGGVLLTAVNGVATVLTTLGATILTLAAIIFLPLIANWEATWKAISNFVGSIFEGIKKIIGGAIEVILGVFNFFFHLITGDWDKLGKDIGNIIDGIAKVFSGIFQDIILGAAKFLADLLLSWMDGVGKILSWLKDQFVNVGDQIASWLGITEVWNTFKSAAKTALDAVRGFIDPIVNAIRSLVEWVQKAIDKLKGLEDLKDIPGKVVKGVTDIPGNIAKGAGDFLGGLYKGAKGFLGFQHGGIMPYTGLAYLHSGERVLTREEASNYNTQYNYPSITVNAQISNDYDVRRLAEKLNEYMGYDINRRLMK